MRPPASTRPYPWVTGMNARAPLAAGAGLVFLIIWVAGAMVLADFVHGLPAAVQFAYFAGAGFLWVFPIRWLMLWSARLR